MAMIAIRLVIACFLSLCIVSLWGHEVLELESNTFEVTLTAFNYLAILFYDESDKGKKLETMWKNAASLLGDTMPANSQMGQILGSDPDLKEIIDAYGISVPSIIVFRKGTPTDYRGPYLSHGMAEYVAEDVKPSISILSDMDSLKLVLSKSSQPVALGFFRPDQIKTESTIEEDIIDESGGSSAFEDFHHFQYAADQLRGSVKFYAITAQALLQQFSLEDEELPTVYLFSNENEGLARYTGPMVDTSLTEWIMRHVAPEMDELTLSSPTGQQYATQFFSSRKLKFILFLPSDDDTVLIKDEILQAWELLSKVYQGKAIFSYMMHDLVPDVLDYFNVDAKTDLPLIAAQAPTTESRYKSSSLDLSHIDSLQEFVSGVISGTIAKIMKSETVPKKQRSLVYKTVGSNLIETVSRRNVDVLLVIYAPYNNQGKQIMPWLEMLAKAVQGESRILIAKIDSSVNDIPSAWNVKSYPMVLWFPAKDKPYANSESRSSDGQPMPVPRPYWDSAGLTLQEMLSFVSRETSFDKSSLRIATSEQLGSLQQDEDMYRVKFEEEDRYERRNEGRVIYQTEIVDYLLGEVVFDGQRWHIGLLAAVVLLWLVTVIALLWTCVQLPPSTTSKGTVAASSGSTGTKKSKKQQ